MQMMTKTNTNNNMYALLIGVDCYMRNKMPNNSYYPCLGGCVRDINHVEDFLRSKLNLGDDQIMKLTASYDGPLPSGWNHDYQPLEPVEQWPTYENMVAKFREVTELAQPGDQVYIHYSGHGGRTNTNFSDLKGKDAFDEALVPTDIGNSEARYLRDVEIAHLLKTMVEKDLIVTIVLDNCHSGGGTRGLGGAVARRAIAGPGVGEPIDTTQRKTNSDVASNDELAKSWLSSAEGSTRALKPGSGWLLEPQGYTLLAACRASESAFEFPFNGVERNGALTFWMLDSLSQIGPWLSYKDLHDRVVAKVHSQFRQQTPQLQGIGDRAVFGSDRVQPTYSVLVMQVEDSRVQLGAGQAAGLRKGAQFAIYHPNTDDFTEIEKRIALVEISELGAVDSWATISEKLRNEEIEQGAPAVLLDPVNIKLQRAVVVLDEVGDRKLQIEKAIEEAGSGFLVLAGECEPAEYQVAANKKGEYEIWDSAGAVVPNLSPVMKLEEPDAPTRIVRRLIHLSKYDSVYELDNRDSNSPLAGALTAELLGKQVDFDPVDGPDPQPFGEDQALQVGEWTFLRIRNNLSPNPEDPNDSERILNITVLDMQPDWCITQVYPAGAGKFEPLDPEQEIVLPLKGALPEGYEEGTDILKIFATLGTPNFRWLELPPLDQPIPRKAALRGAPGDPLDQLLAAVGEDGPPSGIRTLTAYASPSGGWVTEQAEIVIKKNGTGLIQNDGHASGSAAGLQVFPPKPPTPVDLLGNDAGVEPEAAPAVPAIEEPPVEAGDNSMTSDNQNNNNSIWSAEFIIQLIKEVVTALLGLAIVIYTLILAYNTVILAGDPKMADAKDILMLMLGLAGVVVGYYFGRVPADARAMQAQEQANAATAQAEQVTAQAHAIADQINHVLDRATPARAEARGAGASRDAVSITADLQRIRDELRAI